MAKTAVSEMKKILRDSRPLQKGGDFFYTHQKQGVANDAGRMTLTGLNPLDTYVAFNILDLKEIIELAQAGAFSNLEL